MSFTELSNLFAGTVSVQDVLLFRNSKEVATPHFYICIRKTNNDVLFLVMSTTQQERLLRYIARNKIDISTIVAIKSKDEDANSPMRKTCWINCNDVYQYTVDEISDLYKSGNIQAIGKLPHQYYQLIVNGICLSPMVDEEIKELLNGG